MARSPKSKKTAAPREAGGLPTRDAILQFVREAGAKVGKREIARAFGVRGDDRVPLKKLLAEMSREGLLDGNRKALKERGRLPPVGVIEIVARDEDGDLIAEPVVWNEDSDRPRIRLEFRDPAHSVTAAELGVGDRVLARVAAIEDAAAGGPDYHGQPIRKLQREQRRLVGIYRAHAKGGGRVLPVDRKQLRDWHVMPGDAADAADGDLVRFDILTRGRQAAPQARIIELLGNPQDQRKVSLIAVHAHGLPDEFPQAVVDEAKALPVAGLDSRTDLRNVQLVTIDPVDARDHDDAGTRRARPRSRQRRRLYRHRRDRRRRALRRTGLQARSGGATARQLRLFPRSRRANAARALVQRPVLAA